MRQNVNVHNRLVNNCMLSPHNFITSITESVEEHLGLSAFKPPRAYGFIFLLLTVFMVVKLLS